MAKLFMLLTGGLGNQMFQYATARALAIRNNLDLVIDPWSGFARDHQYRRKFELNNLQITARIATPIERIPIWTYRIAVKLSPRGGNTAKFWFGTFIRETEMKYQQALAETPIHPSTWLLGYWQSYLYFAEQRELISRELMPPTPSQESYRQLGEEMRSSESIAIGIRLYEEARCPKAHARHGRVKTESELRLAVKRIQERVNNPRFFVFCTKRSPIFAELDLPPNATWVTPEEGFEGSAETLWLLTQCRHHLITNSTFYWWGAWLSEASQVKTDKFIFAADNFINPDTIPRHWETF